MTLKGKITKYIHKTETNLRISLKDGVKCYRLHFYPNSKTKSTLIIIEYDYILVSKGCFMIITFLYCINTVVHIVIY